MTSPNYNDEMVQSLSQAIARGEAGFSNVPGLLKAILRDKLWQRRSVALTGAVVTFDHFEQFANATPPDGLGTDVRTLEKLCHQDKEALDALDQAVRPPRGGDRRSAKFKGDIITSENSAPRGTSVRGALRRLAQDRPDLYEKVLAGEVTAHGAMVVAGFRPRTIAIYPADIERTARVVLKYFDPAELQTLMELLRAGPASAG